MRPKLTNEIIDERLKNRTIYRIGNYINNKTKITFGCKIETCKNIWEAAPKRLLIDGGCPKCNNRQRLTNEIIDQRLQGRLIYRIGDCINSSTKIDFGCLVEQCLHIWKASPNTILDNHGCPKCSGRLKLTNEIIDERLKGRNIKRLGNYINNRCPIDFGCLIETCLYIWNAAPDQVMNQKTGCPKCAGKQTLTNEIIDERLKGRNIKRLGNYINNKTKIEFECLVEGCCLIWKANTNNLIDRNSGCPKCSLRKNEKLIYKILQDNNINFNAQQSIKHLSNQETSKIRVDFYLPKINTIIEYNGIQHYKPTRFFGNISQEQAEINFLKQQERDKYLQQFCHLNQINLIWIDGREYKYKKLEKYIIENIIPNLKIKVVA